MSASILITGANSGLGYAICCRLIDEFLVTRPPSSTLTLILTARDKRKGDSTVERLRQYAGSRDGPRLSFQPEILDLNSIRSVQTLARKLRRDGAHIDAMILNAGIGGWLGVNWPLAVYGLLTNWAHAVTWPEFKMSAVGWVTKPQLLLENAAKDESEPPLGEVFCANVFGHYLLSHYLAPLLSSDETHQHPGRVIWLSSLEAYDQCLLMDDFQGIQNATAYEASKRITDVLALTSHLPSTQAYVQRYLPSAEQSRPKLYVSHPGICSTGIFPLPYLLTLAMTAAFYIARWLGSMWHTCKPYSGACAPVWLALAPQSTLDDMETRDGKGKWGSATDWFGNARVARTEVEGWGYGGVVGIPSAGRRGRWKHARDLTKEDREEFEQRGIECWREMEALRVEWETRGGKL